MKALKNVLRENASLMSTATALENKTLSGIVEYWRNIQTNVNRSGSDIWRLDTMQGVRRDDNLYAKYNAGAYGVVPDI